MQEKLGGRGIVVEEAIGFWIHRVYQASRNEMFRAFRERGQDVTPEQWAVLIRLLEADGRTQSDLSESTFRDPPTMSRIVEGMEKRGLLERRPHPHDGRVRTVHLTRKGRDTVRQLVPVVEEIVKKLTKGIDRSSLATTRDVLRRMFANAG